MLTLLILFLSVIVGVFLWALRRARTNYNDLVNGSIIHVFEPDMKTFRTYRIYECDNKKYKIPIHIGKPTFSHVYTFWNYFVETWKKKVYTDVESDSMD